MRRRVIIAATITALLAVGACSSDSPSAPAARVGFIRPVPAQDGNAAFDLELSAKGFTIGRNLTYVQDDPNGEVHVDAEDIHRLVKGWLADGIDLIVAFSSSGAGAAAKAAPDTPILFLVNDPVAVGLVTDKARPDRNLTGVTFRIPADRTLDLARQAMPDLARIGILMPATDPAGPPSRDAMLAAATSMGIETVVETFADEEDISRAIGALNAMEADAIAVVNAPTSIRFLSVIEPAAMALNLPLIANTSLATQAVVVLEPDVDALLKRLGRQAARLLSGTPPADIPVEDPTEFRVVLNRTVARQLGLPVFSAALLRQADLVVG